MRRVRPGERGAALLTVLLLVAILGALAVVALEKMRLSTALAANSAALDQARAYGVGIESLLAARVDDLIAANPERTTLAGGWNGEKRRIPLPGGGVAEAVLRDGGNCFNVNSVADGDARTRLTPRAAGIAQFAALLRLLGVPERDAQHIAEATGDWVDSDLDPNRAGAEDSAYARAETPYRTGNTLIADISELRAVNGMNAEIYARVRPWLCALPSTELSPINVNTLAPSQAPLLAMIAPQQVSVDAARNVLAGRPAAGWGSLTDFYRAPALAGLVLPLDVQLQPQLRTRWYALDLRIGLRGAELAERALVDARIAPARVVVRRWGGDD